MSNIKNDYLDIELRNNHNDDVKLLIDDIENLTLELQGEAELYEELQDKTSDIMDVLKRAGINDSGDLKLFINCVEALIDNRPDAVEGEISEMQNCFDSLEQSFDYSPDFKNRYAPIVPSKLDKLEKILCNLRYESKTLARYKPAYAQNAAITLNNVFNNAMIEINTLKGDK